VLAPTGTIGFMMDCDTTGIEPDIALVKYKKLVGGGMLKIVNQTVPSARSARLPPRAGQAIVDYIERTRRSKARRPQGGAPAVFDCAFKPRTASRSIHYMGHVR
jgi:ribonucleoside-diphosphate reductase alpha chain